MDKLEIRIIPDNRMIPIAVSATQEYARYYFQNEKDVRSIGLALEEAIANITEHLTGNREHPLIVTADAHDGNFVMTITDKELPGELDTVLKDENALGMTVMENLMDEVRYEYLGMDGRRQILTKHYESGSHVISSLDFTEEEVEAEGDKHTYTIRPPKEEEMLEIVRMLYREYGNTYDVPGAYSADHHWRNIQNDQAYFLVAVAENGEIAANLTISRFPPLTGIWDISLAFAKERYRKGNLLNRLAAEIIDYAEKRGDISGILIEATVVHPYTQRSFNHYDFMPVGFSLSMMPETIYQPKINAHEGRGSLAEAMRMFRDDGKTVYIRPEQESFVADIAASLDINRKIITAETECLKDECVVDVDFVKVLDMGYVYFNEIGRDFDDALRRIDMDVRKNGGATIEVFINADDPCAVFAQNLAVRHGYFCVRYIPIPDASDYIVFARMYSEPANYADISTTSPYTEMLERVRQFDPEQQD